MSFIVASTMNRTFTPELDAGVLTRLAEYAAHFAKDFHHPRQRAWCGVYLAGLLQDGERKSIEPLSRRVSLPAALTGTKDPDQGLQQFVSASAWDEGALGERYRALLSGSFADAAGVFVLDDTTFPKAGTHSVGVQRQYCGALGKKANCQAAVSLHYVGKEGHLPLALRLFLPESWLASRRAWTGRACQSANAARSPRARSPWSCSTVSARRTSCRAGWWWAIAATG